ncbi:hypothetical protein F5I97DRAFT_1304692 [Phlebopus sp. FC_14]|nr:hypothetical protein F5I97DRAFT_1304692 [Phlebopus sp. FC_14]
MLLKQFYERFCVLGLDNASPHLVSYNYANVPTLIGTPPQPVNTTIDISAYLLTAYALDCVLCSGTQFFNSAISSTFQLQSLNYSWDESEPHGGH